MLRAPSSRPKQLSSRYSLPLQVTLIRGDMFGGQARSWQPAPYLEKTLHVTVTILGGTQVLQ